MIQPNFDLMLWIIFWAMCLRSVAQMILGAIGHEKPTKYDGGDIAAGLIWLIVCIIILVK